MYEDLEVIYREDGSIYIPSLHLTITPEEEAAAQRKYGISGVEVVKMDLMAAALTPIFKMCPKASISPEDAAADAATDKAMQQCIEEENRERAERAEGGQRVNDDDGDPIDIFFR